MSTSSHCCGAFFRIWPYRISLLKSTAWEPLPTARYISRCWSPSSRAALETYVTIAGGAWRRIPCACSIAKCRVVARRQRTPLNSCSHLSPQAKSHFDDVLSTLSVLGIPWRLNPRLVRGLDYYCLTAFEITSSHLGAQNAVGAGGRYDGLVELLGGPVMPAVGFAAGLERIAMMLPEKSLPPSLPSVYVAAFGSEGGPAGVRLLDALRLAGVSAQSDYRATTLKGHLRQADRSGCRFAVLLGDDEAKSGSAVVRNMDSKVPRDCGAAGSSSLFSLADQGILGPGFSD